MSIEAGAIKYLADELCGSGLIRDEVRANIFKRLTEAEEKQEKKKRRLHELKIGDTFRTGTLEWIILDSYKVFPSEDRADDMIQVKLVAETGRSFIERGSVPFGDTFYPDSNAREEVGKLELEAPTALRKHIIEEDVSLETASFQREEESIRCGMRLLTYEEIRTYRKLLGTHTTFWTMTAWDVVGDMVITAGGMKCRASADRKTLENKIRLCCAIDDYMEIEEEEKE